MGVRLTRGDAIGAYLVERAIGCGGEGTVYEAVHLPGGTRVAIKQFNFLASDPAEKESLKRARRHEAFLGLRTPHVVEIVDAFVHTDGFYYVAMELLCGDSLRDHLDRSGAIALDLAEMAVADLLHGLVFLHGHAVYHRDIKPENLMFVWRGDALRAVVTDLGIAHHARSSRITRTEAPCTPEYAAPELALSGKICETSDVFSAGIVAYEAISGGHPFGDIAAPDEFYAAMRCGDFPDICRFVPEAPGAFDAWFRRVLAWNPEDRPKADEALKRFQEVWRETPGSDDEFSAILTAPAAIESTEAVILDGPKAPCLVLLSGTRAGERVPIPPEGLCLGRMGLNPEDGCISRVHLRVIPRGVNLMVADLGTPNGLIYRGKRTRRACLRPGDEVRVGHTDALFEYVTS